MLSNNLHWNQLSSMGFDDLFSLSNDFNPQSDSDEYSMLFDDLMKKEIFSPPETDPYQLQKVLPDDSAQESQVPTLECGVCGAPAFGYNFDQITCESCKAFFRRNAFRDMSQLRCRLSGSCVINIETRRQCTYCRLKKCFDIKMRKDWIRTDEEKRIRQLQKLAKEQKKSHHPFNGQLDTLSLATVSRRKKRLMTNSTGQYVFTDSIYSQKVFGHHRNLSSEHRMLFNNIINAYQLGENYVNGLSINNCISTVSLVQYLNEQNTMHESLIYFYKSIPEFKQLRVDDQMVLIKCNLIKIIHLHYILIEKFQENPSIGLYMLKWISEEFHYGFSRARRHFDCFKEHSLI
ncbi:unnamed protein product [Rotaria socialis]|uniref:Nuclear receptor domain-containing protein n=2 Tax=Rotaria socialis TaxID=392032 RepID=A0A820U700_9BILA|nr:unnamed protein product [Rotaria socialis]